MFKEKLLIQNQYSRLRNTLAILLYIVFMVWIIYSHNKSTSLQPTSIKKTVAIY